MIPVIQLLHKIDLKLNKLSTLEHQFISDDVKIMTLNECQIKLLKKKVNPDNNYGLGFDAFKKRYQDLQFLVVPYKQLALTEQNDALNSYTTVDITTLTPEFFLPVDMYVLANKGKCEDRKLKVIDVVKHGDLQLKLDSPHWKPSFEYQETLVTFSENKLFVYTDGSHDITSLYLSYLRYPKNVDVSGYVHLDGSTSTDVDCELPKSMEDELVDLTVQELAMNTENQSAVQYSEMRKKEND